MPSERIKGLIRRRDEGICWHCGTDVDTTIHHRRNRGMGGDKTRSKMADVPSNLLTICQHYNFLMESDINAIREARDNGWKLRKGELSLYTSVKRYDGTWWLLTDHGDKFQLEQEGLF